MDTKKPRIPAILVDADIYRLPSSITLSIDKMLSKVPGIIIITNTEDEPSPSILSEFSVVIRNSGSKDVQEFKRHALSTILDMSNMHPVVVFDRTYDLATLTMYDDAGVLEVIR